jgi:hypothetical protein
MSKGSDENHKKHDRVNGFPCNEGKSKDNERTKRSNAAERIKRKELMKEDERNKAFSVSHNGLTY